MESNAWWRTRRFELVLALAAVVFVGVGVLVDLRFHSVVERAPITSNVVASFLALPLLSLAAILVLNKGERRAAEAHAQDVERRRLLRVLADAHHRVSQAQERAPLLMPEVVSALRRVAERDGSHPVEWRHIRAADDDGVLTRLVQAEPRGTRDLAAVLQQVSDALEGIATVGGDRSTHRASLHASQKEVRNAAALLEELLEPAPRVCHGLRFIRHGRRWDGQAVVDAAGSSFTVRRTDVADTADLAARARDAVERAKGLVEVVLQADGHRAREANRYVVS